MAYEASRICVGTLTASADLSDEQYRFAKISGANTVDVCDGTVDQPIGVIQNNPKSGESVELAIFGLSKVKSGGTIAVGATVGTDATGEAITVTRSIAAIAAANRRAIVGIAITAAADGDVFTVMLTPGLVSNNLNAIS